jgi:hypothetical protein
VVPLSLGRHPKTSDSKRLVSVAAGIEAWGDGTTAGDRVAFAIQLRYDKASFAVSIIDGSGSTWPTATFLGRPQVRADALAKPNIQDVFDLTDHIVVEDEAINTCAARMAV